MPELPEVETTVKGLQERVLNRTFIDAWSDWKKIVKRPKDFEIFKKELKGKKIQRVWRRAKNVIFELSSGYSLLVHMKMTGHLLYGKYIFKNNPPTSTNSLYVTNTLPPNFEKIQTIYFPGGERALEIGSIQ